MKYLSIFVILVLTTLTSQAKIWRINNNIGVTADFTSYDNAINATSVVSGDTLYFESSATEYSSGGTTINKKLVLIGPGYFHNPNDTNFPNNTGLQAAPYSAVVSYIPVGEGGSGTRILGLTVGNLSVLTSASPINLTVERCNITSGLFFSDAAHSGITVRKCFFQNASIQNTSGSLTNFVCENNIFYNTFGYVNMTNLTGSSNVFRNNSFYLTGAGSTLVNCYVANNIFYANTPFNFTNCTIKNNLFAYNQSLPNTATGNQLSVDMSTVYTGGTTGSIDSRVKLKASSPAIAAGLTIGAVITPDCGAYGATDPYKVSGIPNIPTIYSLTVPNSISSGTATMNITFSTRNNN